MTEPAAVPDIGGPQPNVIASLEKLLAMAKTGELTSVACAYEMRGGYSGHECAFGSWGNRPLTVGKLHVLATHIILNECLEWRPE